MKSTKWLAIPLLLVMGLSLLVTACAKPKPTETLHFRFDIPWAEIATVKDGLFKWAEEITQKTGGRVVIEPFTLSKLGYRTSEVPSVMQSGVLELADISLTATGGSVSIAPISSALGLAITPEDSYAIARANWDMLEEGFGKLGVIPLMVSDHGKMVGYSRKPAASLAELKAFKIAVLGKEQADVLTRLGIPAVVMGYGEIAPAMGKGVVDGTILAPGTGLGFKYYETLKGVNDDLSYGLVTLTSISKSAWDKLTSQEQKIFRETSKKYEELMLKQIAPTMQQNDTNALAGKGMTISKLPAADIQKFREVGEAYWTEWAAAKGDLERKAVQNALKAVKK
ncbi:MAG: TRAP transporter substrate-binding protein DctP [Chloroflexi bacterium]|nr:TRAP transporter substrate-binding protein DctP [Chloroflexota bacterium]